MKTNWIFKTAIIFALSTTIFYGCKKDSSKTDSDVTYAEDENIAQSTFDDAANISDEAYISSSTSKSGSETSDIIGPCATKTLDTISPIHVLTIDFGTTNCLCGDGKYRRGKIIVTFTKKYLDTGSFKETTFNNYYVNDNKVEGTHKITNNGRNQAGHYTFSNVTDGRIIFADSTGTRSWTANRTREWIEGDNTPRLKRDDVYLITGTSSGVRRNSLSFSTEILTPVRLEIACKYKFVSGTVKIKVQGKPDRILDYGNGACDPYSTVTINGKTHKITKK